MARDSGYKDLLDYTVSYKTVWTIIGLVVALGVVGWFAWQRFKPPLPGDSRIRYQRIGLYDYLRRPIRF